MSRSLSQDMAFWRDTVFPVMNAIFDSGFYSLDLRGGDRLRERLGAPTPTADEPFVYVANHSGWVFIDMFMCAYGVYHYLGEERFPYGVALDLMSKVPGIRQFGRRIGAVMASALRDPRSLPQHVRRLAVFPEGAEGNTKPFWKAYRIQRFRTGFVRFAIHRRARIIPIAVVGGEESVPVVATIELFRPLLKAPVPVPLLPVPLPSQWRIQFLDPIDVPNEPALIDDYELCARIADDVREVIQTALDDLTPHHRLARLSRWIARARASRSD